MDQTPIISAQNLNHTFGQGSQQKQVLFDIDLTIFPGEIILLEGPSGSGKTTLLTIISGLRSCQSGSLKVLDFQLLGSSRQQMIALRREIGYIFQSHNLIRSLTVLQNVQMALETRHLSANRRDAEAVNILESVGLKSLINSYPDDLSGGQKQRVAIARALVRHPKIVLADEPTASLDSKSGRQVVTLIQQLAREQNCTILMVTHDNRVLDIADRIIHMEDGRLSS
ncbi:MAG: ATP-binding cassette domain-containing protein [Synechococcaceae cyanobacterium]